MKILRLLLCLSSFFALSWVSTAAASEYLGDFCWRTEPGPIVRFSVSHEGGKNYSLHGKGTYTFNHIESAVFGSATLTGNTILVNYTSSASDPATDETMTVNVNGVLDSTLNGTFTATFITFEGATSKLTKGSGTLTLVSCP